MSNYAISAVRDYSEATGTAYALLLTIADGVDSEDNNMHGRSVERIARLAHLHRWDATEEQKRNARRRCQRLINELVSSGELIVRTGGYRTKSVYFVPILPGELGYDPQPCEDPSHDCNHFHTSLTVSREGLHLQDADKRLNADRFKRQRDNYRGREAAPEPPQTRPIDHPSAETAREAAPEPPQTRPIDHGGAAPEPPQTRPLGRRVSHTYPTDIPVSIPETADTSKNESCEDGAPPPADLAQRLAQFDAEYPDVECWAREAGYWSSRAVVDARLLRLYAEARSRAAAS